MARDIAREALRDQVEKEVQRQSAIAELEHAAERFERKALDGTYTLQKDLRDYYTEKARSCRREAAKLKGEDVLELDKTVVKTVVVSGR